MPRLFNSQGGDEAVGVDVGALAPIPRGHHALVGRIHVDDIAGAHGFEILPVVQGGERRPAGEQGRQDGEVPLQGIRGCPVPTRE